MLGDFYLKILILHVSLVNSHTDSREDLNPTSRSNTVQQGWE